MHLIENERAKLTAPYINGLAITVFAIGGFAPTISFFSEDRPQSSAIIAVALHRHQRSLTSDRKAHPRNAEIMMTEQFLSVLIAPAGGLLLGVWCLWLVRRDAKRLEAHKKPH